MKAKRHNEETPRESAYLYMYIGFNDMKFQKNLKGYVHVCKSTNKGR